ncbi:purine catabolism regulatory protein-like family [Gordoniibacillus kamchatkensis]|uniref:Purine catabolism regulatory protein-like family n=1 Tax=Gordoniibacillus kamchatkensis TaxID=1590651 RepID=A0ABR5API5_9BACL|nr:PucR family transcriptional regulator [Paenibacillus sp. VKM B-2647]KIL42445.1 purine catabolism regulatory protein-like family [Paenibacillus sp. VKM B-2647]
MKFKGLTVKDLLKLPILRDSKLISGEKGLDRIVRYIDIMEVPDVTGWLREGELILTTGYSIRHDPALLLNLVEQLAQAGAAALGIKPERFMTGIPQEALDLGNRYNLPIIQIPNGIPYIDITYTVMEQILDKQAALLRRSEEVYKTLTNLVLNNSGIQVVADNVAELVKCPIWIVGNNGELLVSSPTTAPYEPSPKSRQWDVVVDKQFVGRLVVGKEHLDELELVCIEQARLVFSLELMRRKIAHDTEQRLRGNFVEELLMGLPLSRQEVENKGRQLGLQPEWLWEVCMIEGDAAVLDETAALFAQVSELVQRESANRKVRFHIQKQADRLVLLLASGRSGLAKKTAPGREQAGEWSEIIGPSLAQGGKVRSGFGGKRPLWEVNRSYIEARKAIALGSRLDKNRHMFTFEEVEMFQLLIESSEHVNFEPLIEKKLGKLSLYDKENGTDLVTTLYYYLATGGSLIETANRMYVHRNSVKYRIDRIKEICDIDLDNALNRFVYYLCAAFYLLKKAD